MCRGGGRSPSPRYFVPSAESRARRPAAQVAVQGRRCASARAIKLPKVLSLASLACMPTMPAKYEFSVFAAIAGQRRCFAAEGRQKPRGFFRWTPQSRPDLSRSRIPYTAPSSRRLNEPKISCFDQFGCNIIGIKTARYNSTRFSKRNVPSSVTGDEALPARL